MTGNTQIKTLWKEFDENLVKFKAGTHANSDNSTSFGSLHKIEIKLNKYLNSEKHAYFGWAKVVHLARWYLENGQYHVLSSKTIEVSHYNKAALGYYWGAVLSDAVGQAVHGKSPFWGWSHEAGAALGMNMLVGWWDKAADIAQVYLRSIQHQGEHNLLVKRGSPYYRAPWFVFELMCLHSGLEFDSAALGSEYPEEMWPYEEALRNWQTTDLLALDKLVYAMAEYHVEQSRSDQNDEQMNEFSYSLWWLFPYEILVFLKMREHAGLRNPTDFSHPLMRESICRVPPGIAEIPEIPILNEFLFKLKQDHPQVFEGIDL